MYSTTVYVVFVGVIALASLFTELVKSYPAKDDENADSLRLTEITTSQNDDETDADSRQLQYGGTAEDRFADTEVVYQKCKRNKRHVHRQKPLQQDATWEENAEVPPSPSTTPLTDEQILDIELQVQIERVKQKILAKLHLDRPPNVTAEAKPQIPPQLARKVLHTGVSDTGGETATEDAGDAKTTQITLIAENGTSECDFPDSSFCYRFTNPSGSSTNDQVIAASIWLYILPDPVSNSSTAQRTVTVTRPGKHYGHRSTLASQLISTSEGWVEVNIEHGSHRFVKHEQYVEVSVTYGTLLLSSLPSQQPKLELDVRNHERATRSTDPRRVCQPFTTQCCMQSYTINFAEIGWDFILEPTEYVANYCRGTCSSSGPFTFDHSQVASLKANHIRIQNRGRSANARAAAVLVADLTPCCAPERLDSLSIMYLNSNNRVAVELLPDMIVRSCGCA